MTSSSSTLRHLLNTLSDESNPITHSDIYARSDTVVSTSTGHQRGERRPPAKTYLKDRSRKLSLQRDTAPKGVLYNVRVYIDGYLSGTTDIDMRATIAQAGGATLLTSSGATHIVTSRQLSASKAHTILTRRTRNPVHVVKPEWITESISAGRRLKESHYSPVNPSSTRNLVDMLRSSRSS